MQRSLWELWAERQHLCDWTTLCTVGIALDVIEEKTRSHVWRLPKSTGDWAGMQDPCSIWMSCCQLPQLVVKCSSSLSFLFSPFSFILPLFLPLLLLLVLLFLFCFSSFLSWIAWGLARNLGPDFFAGSLVFGISGICSLMLYIRTIQAAWILIQLLTLV